MAQEIGKDTNVNEYNKTIESKRRLFGLTSNSFGRVVVLHKLDYEGMIKKNETILDENGLNENFVTLTDADLEIMRKFQTSTDKKDEAYTKLMVSKISKLRNFMSKLSVIPFEKTDLSEEVYEALLSVKTPKNASADELAEKDEEIKRLQAQLKEATKKPKAPEKTTPEAPKAPEVPEDTSKTSDDPFSN